MCLATSSALIQDVVTKFVNADQMFTAFDVTLEVKALASARNEPSERHRDLRHDIHNAVQQYIDASVYEKTLRDVGAPERAFVYHPTGSDAANYVPRSRGNNPRVVSNTIAAAQNPTVAPNLLSSSSNVGTGRLPDARGTLLVPANLLRSVGMKHEDTAFVYTRQDAAGKTVLSVTKEVPAGFSSIAKYTVDYHDNVRITHVQLIAGGIQSSTGYAFEVDGTEVIIRAV
jgi:hypothetical protein